ncbi:MAG TPA: hypothetical protein VEB86_13450 [Chryseosolibacter sp.]|nr:hypothetical protein [Chryseosolibacter sp.]
MRKYLAMLAIAFMATSFVACDDDESTPDGPAISAPASVTNVQVGASSDVTFSLTMPGGYKSASIAAVGGTAVTKTEPAAGAKTGDLIVTYTADASTGAGTVSITVTDKNDKFETETAAINKTEIPAPEVVVVSGSINSNTTWTADKIYELAGRVIVKDGVTLTIQAGTIVKGREGGGINATALMIARGGKLMAEGTAAAPIIFTSVLDNILPGEKAGTTLDEDDRGKWGGVVVLGRAPISVSGATEAQIEGVPAGETAGLYGGDVAADNSGVIRYVSIRHGGTVLSGGSEINGLTLGGVGSGTTIENIEVFGNVDDGIELFGGSVNLKNVMIAYQGDDAIDIDQAYSGTIDGFFVIHGGDTDEGLEIDGPEGTANATGKFTLKNGTLKGDPSKANDAASLCDFKSKAQGTVENVIFVGYPAGKKLKIAASYDESNCTVGRANAFSNLKSDVLVFSTVQFTGFTVSVYNSAASSGNPGCPVPAEDQGTAESKIVSNTVSTGLPPASTWSWTISGDKGFL